MTPAQTSCSYSKECTVPKDSPGFDKYEENGGYHWHLTDRSWANSDYNPLMEARFEVIVRELARKRDAIGPTLDVGCGDGFLLSKVGAVCPDLPLHGIDIEDGAVTIARQKLAHRDQQAQLRQGSVYEIPYGINSFSVVLMTEVIEHLEEPSIALEEIHRVLEPGGLLLLTTPHRQPDFQWDEEYHIQEFTWTELSGLLEQQFDAVDGRGFLPMSWVRSWRKGVLRRVGMRFYSRLFYNPLMRTSPTPSVDYGQILAVARNVSHE